MPQIYSRLLFALAIAVPLGTNLPLTISPALAQSNQITAQDTETDRPEPISEADRPSQVLLQVQGVLEPGDSTLRDNSLYDEYHFEGRAGETIGITLESLEFDTYLHLIAPDGTKLAENDDASSGNYNSWITITLPVDGTYRVLANAYDDQGRGQYSLTVAVGVEEPAFSEAALRQVEAGQLNQQGLALLDQGSFREALPYFEQALAIYLELGDRQGEGLSLIGIGGVYHRPNQYPEALGYFQQALDIFHDIGNRQLEGTLLTNLGRIHASLDQYPEALTYFQRSLVLAQDNGDSLNEAERLHQQEIESEALNNIGSTYFGLRQYPEALEYYQRSIVISQRIGDRSSEALTLDNIGKTYFNLAQYPQALEYYQRALVICQELGRCHDESELLNHIGSTYFYLDQYPEALEYYQRALAVYHQLSDRSGEETTLDNIGDTYANQSQYPEALEYYQRALAIRQELNDSPEEGLHQPQSEVELLITIGNIYYRLGQYLEALDCYQQWLLITQEIGDREGEGEALANIGRTYQDLAQYSEALEAYQRALTIFQEIGHRRGEGELLNSIASVYFNLGQDEMNLDYYQQLLALTRELGDRRAEGRVLSNLGGIHYNLEQYPEALEYYEQSLAILQEVGDRWGEAATLSDIGSLYNALEQYPEALSYHERSLNLRQQISYRAGEGYSLNNIGRIYFNLGQYQQALDYYQRSLSIMREIGDRETEGVTLANIGRLLDTQEQPEVAIVFLKQSVNVRESIREGLQTLPQELQQSYTNTVADDYRFLADLLLSQGRVIEAQQVLELLKLEELREFTRNARGLESEQGIALNPVEQGILEEFGTLVAFGKQMYDCEQSRCAQLSEYRQQRQAQSTRFDTQVTAFVQTIRDNRQTDDFFYDPRYLNETAREIVAEPGTLLIYPFVTENQLWLLYTAAGDVAGAIPVDVTQLELGETVVHFRELLESPYSNLEELQATGKQLYDWLIAPLESELQANQITTLVFSQDRVTRYIPMAALWDGDRYLMQTYTLSTILSAELTDMSDRLPALPTDTSILALGLSASVLDLDPLPYVEHELDAVVRLNQADSQGIYPGMELLNGDFNRDALVANLFGHGVVHIATHGSFVAGLPEESFLVLGDGDRFNIPDINSIGSDLRDVHLVVLSACETAVGGPDADGIEVAGISSYFLAANRASAVMASLWLVNDCSTSLLMQQFYENLAQGMSKAEALRIAQQALLESDVRVEDCENRMFVTTPREGASPPQASATGYSHPYYWAPFILIGNGL